MSITVDLLLSWSIFSDASLTLVASNKPRGCALPLLLPRLHTTSIAKLLLSEKPQPYIVPLICTPLYTARLCVSSYYHQRA
ncbi:hypothetical protein F5Y13DRAFT_152911 [Hypoxylon sp. FL1857]|nr:hypothetical protein F5Y13DRAFT_152911 [Hypoxylon sp. FL1857]